VRTIGRPARRARRGASTRPAIRCETLDGFGGGEGVMVVRSRDGVTIVFNDAVFNMPHGRGLSGVIVRHLTGSTGGPRASRVVRLFVVKDLAAFRARLLRLADTPDLRRAIVSHHRMIAGAAIREAAATV
jgi:hypothetical protein